jgi:2-aminoadipate transaminase
MDYVFADRMADVPRSFIREILKVALDHSYISFAGGLPNPNLFPVKELKQAAGKVFQTFGNDVLQYADSEGSKGLREVICQRYLDLKGLKIHPDQVLITTGSQQGIDLAAKCLLNEGDPLIIEEPSYLAAIQSFSIFRPRFLPVKLNDDGIDISGLKQAFATAKPRLMYSIPCFQNPSGISYSEKNKHEVANIIEGTNTILIEDDPYGELRFAGTPTTSFKKLLPENTILLGTFSKIVAPSLRLGWMVAPEPVMNKLIVAKQAADLHTSYFLQCMVYQYLKDNDIEKHIEKIRDCYGRQCRAMIESIKEFFPSSVIHTRPEGGMFLWAALPEQMSARALVEVAMKDKVIFVPGDTFFVNKKGANTMRLNFSCADETLIRTGIERLGKAIKKLIK